MGDVLTIVFINQMRWTVFGDAVVPGVDFPLSPNHLVEKPLQLAT